MPEPLVRVVVLNHDGAPHVYDAVASLEALDWPRERLEIVVVDNASSDGSDREIERRFPGVEVRRTGANLGFPANNVALVDLEGVTHVALLNNDATVAPDWLRRLVPVLDGDPGLGAVCPRILFAPRFVDVVVEAPTFRPGGADPRALGVRVSGVRVAGEDRWRAAQLVDGHHGLEHGTDGPFRWTDARATVRVPLPVDASEALPAAALRLSAERAKEVTVRCGGREVHAAVDADPAWVDVPLAGEPYDVVNNVGSVVLADGHGADRGFLEPDDGRFDRPADVLAWCGAAVLFRRDYLRDVGLFDERFFVYYEDSDLSWRGRARGWRYRYVPEAVVRHVHAATSVEGSALFQHYVERNRLYMLTKNAPRGMVVRAVVRYLAATASYARRDVLGPLRRGRRPGLELLRRRIGSLLAYLRLLPAALGERRRLRRRQVVPDADLVRGLVPPTDRPGPSA